MDHSALFSTHLNQTVVWSAYSSRDAYNKKTYTETTIAARSEGKRRMVTTLEGEKIVSQTTIYTASAIGDEDLIDGRRVLQVLDMVDGQGNIIGYEVLVQ